MNESVPTQHVLTRHGCPLHFWLSGPRDRPLIVFTHGTTMDHHMFDAQVAAIAHEYRVLTWDVRGHGHSQPIGAAFSARVCVDDLVAILDHLGYQQATLVGHSMGGYIAQEFAFRHPQRVTAVVIIGGTCITLKHSWFMRGGVRVLPLIARFTPTTQSLERTRTALHGTPETATYAVAAARQIAKHDVVTIWTGLARVLHYEPTYRIEQPLLLTHGAQDTLGWPQTFFPRWAARDPKSQYLIIPDAGHNAHQDNPPAFNDALLRFCTPTCRYHQSLQVRRRGWHSQRSCGSPRWPPTDP